jgi:integrase/recombinase XerD
LYSSHHVHTINTKLSGLVKFNEFLIHSKEQSNLVIEKSDFVKVQQQYASLAKVEFQDAEMFRQLVLDSGKARNYAIVTVLAYGGESENRLTVLAAGKER